MNIPINSKMRLLQAVFILLCSQSVFAQKVVRYELYVKDTLVNYAGKEKGYCGKRSDTDANAHIYRGRYSGDCSA